MKQKTFEQYLMDDVWQPRGVLDDDMADAFEAWLTSRDVAMIMQYAEEWGSKEYEKGCYNTTNEANSLTSNPN